MIPQYPDLQSATCVSPCLLWVFGCVLGWFEDDIEALLESLENMEEHADFVCNKVPSEVWSSLRVGNHSPESCHKIWNKICQVVSSFTVDGRVRY